MTLTLPRERWSRLSPNMQGALWLLLSCLGFSVMATFVKFAAREVSPFEITFFRCFFGLLVLAPAIAWHGIGALRTRHLGMHAWRGILGATAMGCAYFGLSRMPLAAYNALSFSKPLFAIVLAVIVLHETVRWRRWAATIVGFLGVMVMMRPGTEAFDPNGLFALGDALSIAILITVLKRLPAYERPLAMLFYFGLVSSPIALLLALPALDLAEPADLGAAGRHRHHRRAVAILVDHRVPRRRSLGGRAVRLFAAAVRVPVRPRLLRRGAGRLDPGRRRPHRRQHDLHRPARGEGRRPFPPGQRGDRS